MTNNQIYDIIALSSRRKSGGKTLWSEMSYNWYVSEATEPEVWDNEYEPTERDWALWIYGSSENELEVIF